MGRLRKRKKGLVNLDNGVVICGEVGSLYKKTKRSWEKK